MLRLLPANGSKSATGPAKPDAITPGPKAHTTTLARTGLVYTMLRHGHGLSHEEAARRMAAGPDGFDRGPFQAA